MMPQMSAAEFPKTSRSNRSAARKSIISNGSTFATLKTTRVSRYCPLLANSKNGSNATRGSRIIIRHHHAKQNHAPNLVPSSMDVINRMVVINLLEETSLVAVTNRHEAAIKLRTIRRTVVNADYHLLCWMPD